MRVFGFAIMIVTLFAVSSNCCGRVCYADKGADTMMRSQLYMAANTDVKELWSSIILDLSTQKINVGAYGLFGYNQSNIVVVGTTVVSSAFVSIDSLGQPKRAKVLTGGGPRDSSFFAAYVQSSSGSADVYGSKGIYNFVVTGPFVLSHLKWSDSGELNEVAHNILDSNDRYFSVYDCVEVAPEKLVCANVIADTVILTTSRLSDDALLSRKTIIGTLNAIRSARIQRGDGDANYLVMACDAGVQPSIMSWTVVRLDSVNNEVSRFTLPPFYRGTPKICVTKSGCLVAWNETTGNSSILTLTYIDDAGTVLWSNQILKDKYCFVAGVNESADGGFIAYGRMSDKTNEGKDVLEDSAMDCLVVKVSSNGSLQWMDRKGYPSLRDVYNNVIEIRPHEYIAVGGCQYDPNGASWDKMFAVRYSESINTSDIMSEEGRYSAALDVRLNNDVLQLSCAEEMEQIQLCSVYGGQVQTVSDLRANWCHLPVQNLASGCYVLMVHTRTKTLKEYVVVIH